MDVAPYGANNNNKSRFELEGLQKVVVPATALAPRSDPGQDWSRTVTEGADKWTSTVTCNPIDVNS